MSSKLQNEINPNIFSYDLLLPVSICIEMFLLKQNKKIKKGLFLFVLALLLFTIILTGSRKTMLAVGAIFAVYIFNSEKRSTLLIGSILIGISIFSFLPDIFFDRWGDTFESRGSGRIDIWIVGLKSLEKYFLFGAGLGNFPSAFDEFMHYAPNYMGAYRAAHNLYLEILVELGLVGFSLMILMMWKHYRAIPPRLDKDDNNQVMLKAVFWAMLTANFFGEFLLRKSFWLLWMMILMYRNVLKSESI